jgi:hypothetical protein
MFPATILVAAVLATLFVAIPDIISYFRNRKSK